ncbi:MAG: class I SAM-dependent methyltransferase [Deltaproteobacteria bacterium]|nr:class I SAM-dependent methyltransferase [Deltaproteobacteria bacterium]
MSEQRSQREVEGPEGFFNELYAELALDSVGRAVDRAAKFLVDVLGVRRGQCVLDQGSGTGAIALAVARQGVEVVGVDIVERYVDRANRRAQQAQLPARFFRGDASDFCAGRLFDGAYSWFTSLGYGAEVDRDLATIACAAQQLRPGAGFVLDYLNALRILKTDRRQSTINFQRASGEVVRVEQRATYLLERGVLKTDWIYHRQSGEVRRCSVKVRLYLPHELTQLTRSAGLIPVSFFGSQDGEALTEGSRRCILVARKSR